MHGCRPTQLSSARSASPDEDYTADPFEFDYADVPGLEGVRAPTNHVTLFLDPGNARDVAVRLAESEGGEIVATAATSSATERRVVGLAPREVEGLGEDKRKSPLDAVLKKLRPRWFVVRDARGDAPTLLNPRWAMSYLRGPMTAVEIRRARESRAEGEGEGARDEEQRSEPPGRTRVGSA